MIVIGLLLLWEIAARSHWISPLFFPAPTKIVNTIIRMAYSGELVLHTGKTISRVFIGVLCGGLTGLVVGLTMGWAPRMKEILDPLVGAGHPIPKIAIFPLIMVIFGIGETSKIVVVALATFFPIVINSVAGVEQINPVHFEVAANYNASRRKILWRVVLPGSLPMIMAGFRIALNVALIVTIAVELAASQEGLGALIWLSWEVFRIQELYASITVVAILGMVIASGIKTATRFLVPWRIVEQ
jgi:NitT/TauT family transport system permease protein